MLFTLVSPGCLEQVRYLSSHLIPMFIGTPCINQSEITFYFLGFVIKLSKPITFNKAFNPKS